MAVLKIEVVSIIGRMAELDRVTEICGNSCVFHPDNTLSFYSDTSDFLPLSEDNPYSEPLQRLGDAVNGSGLSLELLPPEATEGFSMGRDELAGYLDNVCAAFNELREKRQDAAARMISHKRDVEDFSHFVGLNLNLDEIRECKFIKVRFGYLPKESFEKLKSYTENPYVIFFPSTSDSEHYWGVYFAPMELVSEVDRIFSSLYFERVRLAELTGSPELSVEEARECLAQAKKDVEQTALEVAALWEREGPRCQRVFSWLTERSVYFGIRRYAARYNDNFILTGWVPAAEEQSFRTQLDVLKTVDYTFTDAAEELAHSPPVLLKNKAPARPFEFFVNMYGLPQYDELDPTTFVAITYIVLFGIMFGDLGQGVCVSIVGYLMWRLKGMALGKALIPCGISSAFFGCVFGSVFGYENLLNPMYKALFGLSQKPIAVMEPDTTIKIILCAVALGVFLMIVAILINIVGSLRRGHLQSALFGPNGIAGLVFYSGLVAGVGGQLAFGWAILTPAYIALVILLPLLVILFGEVLGGLVEHRPNWKPDSWGGYVVESFFELFEILLGYASNTISFLRVSAFVLVHAGMMTMVFILAEMAPPIGYVAIVVVGNIIVMAMEGLLVGIQVMRLEFYEMFSRFFEGGGRPFSPVLVRGEKNKP